MRLRAVLGGQVNVVTKDLFEWKNDKNTAAVV